MKVVAGIAAALAALGAFAAGAGAARSAPCAQPGPVRHLVLASAATGAVEQSFPDTDGGVDAVLADGRGGWLVAGWFRCVGDVKVPPLVHLNADGTLDAGWHADASVRSPVIALARRGDAVYAGGSFGVVALDAATGAFRWRAPVHGRVFALAAGGSRVYAGGDFDTVRGRPHPSLVALDSRNGAILPWRAAIGGTHGSEPALTVYALALAGTRLYVGGDSITSVNGVPRASLSAVTAASGRLLPWNPGAKVGDVETILPAVGLVLTAGRDGFGVTSAATARQLPLVRRVHGVASQFASSGGTTYLAGDCRNSFDAVGGLPRNNLAAVDASGHVTSWAPDVAKYTCVASLAASSEAVLVAGGFSATLG